MSENIRALTVGEQAVGRDENDSEAVRDWRRSIAQALDLLHAHQISHPGNDETAHLCETALRELKKVLHWGVRALKHPEE